jgi:hypothetical protein
MMRFNICYLLALAMAFAHSNEEWDFATHLSSMGDLTFIISDPQTIPNLYVLEGNPVDLLDYFAGKGELEFANYVNSWQLKQFRLRPMMRYIQRMNTELAMSVYTKYEKGYYNKTDEELEDKMKTAAFYLNGRINKFSIGFTGRFLRSFSEYNDYKYWNFVFNTGIYFLYSWEKIKTGVGLTWQTRDAWEYLPDPWPDPWNEYHGSSFDVPIYLIVNYSPVEYVFVFHCPGSNLADIYSLYNRFIINKAIGDNYVRAGIELCYLNELVEDKLTISPGISWEWEKGKTGLEYTLIKRMYSFNHIDKYHEWSLKYGGEMEISSVLTIRWGFTKNSPGRFSFHTGIGYSLSSGIQSELGITTMHYKINEVDEIIPHLSVNWVF